MNSVRQVSIKFNLLLIYYAFILGVGAVLKLDYHHSGWYFID